MYRKETPFYLLLDDTFAEIDEKNSQYLIEKLTKKNQVIYVTTTAINFKYFKKTGLYRIEKGKLYNENT